MFVILILHVLLLFLYNINYIFCFTGGCLAINTLYIMMMELQILISTQLFIH